LPRRTRSRGSRLLSTSPDAELYDVTALSTLCRAPCGEWLELDGTHRFAVGVNGPSPSTEFALDEELTHDVDVRFTPRDENRHSLGLALTITGAVIAGAGILLVAAWMILDVVVQGVAELILAGVGLLLDGSAATFPWTFQYLTLLYIGAGGIAAGVPFLGGGISLMLTGRERFDVMPRDGE
jgi:hypothetical protein